MQILLYLLLALVLVIVSFMVYLRVDYVRYLKSKEDKRNISDKDFEALFIEATGGAEWTLYALKTVLDGYKHYNQNPNILSIIHTIEGEFSFDEFELAYNICNFRDELASELKDFIIKKKTKNDFTRYDKDKKRNKHNRKCRRKRKQRRRE